MKRLRTVVLGFIFFVSPVFLIWPAGAAGTTVPGGGGVVLALSGGGMKGLAHIGVLHVLREAGIPVAGIVGTSMGSIIGGLAACGYAPEEIERAISETDMASLLRDDIKPSLVPPGEEGTANGSPLLKLEFDAGRKLSGPMGGMAGVRVFNRLSALTAQAGTADFMELPIPFAAVATDLETGEMVVIRQGSLAGAIRSSMAIPGVFAPWTHEGRLLVDGGLVANVPVSAAKALFPGYPVVAVDVSSGLKTRQQIRSVVDVIDQMTTFMTKQNVDRELAAADLVIRPDTRGVPILDAGSGDHIVEMGVLAAREVLPGLRSLVASAPRAPGPKSPQTRIVTSVEAAGISPERRQDLLGDTWHWLGAPPDMGAIRDTVDRLRTEGDFATVDATYEDRGFGTAVVFNIQKKAPYEVEFGGYTTNIAKAERGVTIQGVRRDLSSDGDLLWMGAKVAEDWELDARYLTPSRANNRWEASLSARRRSMEPANAPDAEWERYGFSLYRTRSSGDWRWGIGATLEFLDAGSSSDGEFAWGPSFYVSYEGLDDDIDPTTGYRWRARGWLRDGEDFLLRAEGFGVHSFSPRWRLMLSAGVEFGESEKPATAAWLGGSDDLLGHADHPYMGDRAAWIRGTLRRVLERSWWGSMNVDLFAALGYTFDSDWSREHEAWEAGVSVSFPNNFLGGQFFVVTTEEDDIRWGFSLGKPMPVRDPLP